MHYIGDLLIGQRNIFPSHWCEGEYFRVFSVCVAGILLLDQSAGTPAI
jgi:hypothetical protein